MLFISSQLMAQVNIYKMPKLEATNSIILRTYRVDSVSNDTNMTSQGENILATQFAIYKYINQQFRTNTITSLPWASVTGKPTANGTTDGILSSADWNGFNGKQTALNGTGLVRMAGMTVNYDNTTYYPASGGNLNTGAYIGFPNISTPSTPSSGIKVYSDTSGRLTWLTNLGYARTFRSASLTGNRIYTLQDRDGILLDSTDLATKIDSIRQPADILYGNAAFTKIGTTGVSNAPLNSQTGNTVFAAPNGSTGTPTFRALVSADIPTILNGKTIGDSVFIPKIVGGTGINSGIDFYSTTNPAGVNANDYNFNGWNGTGTRSRVAYIQSTGGG